MFLHLCDNWIAPDLPSQEITGLTQHDYSLGYSYSYIAICFANLTPESKVVYACEQRFRLATDASCCLSTRERATNRKK